MTDEATEIPDFIPRPYQLDFLRAMDNGLKRAVLVWHRRCIAKGTQVLMFNGSVKNIEDLVKGDKILSHNGERVVEDEIIDVWSAGTKETVIGKSSGQMPICATKDHRFATSHQGSKNKINWTPLSEASLSNQMALLYKGVNHGDVSEPCLSEWLGYMLTDGYVNAHQQPKFTNINKEILLRVEELTKSLWDMDVIWRKKGNGYDIGMTSGQTGSQLPNPIKRWFNKHKITGSREDRRLPKIVWDWDRETVGRFFAGVISGDGCIYTQKLGRVIEGKSLSPSTEIKISCGLSKNMADDMYWLLRKHGFICSPVINESRHTNWMVRIWNRDSVKKLLSFGKIYGKEDKRLKAIESYSCKRLRKEWNDCHRAHIKTEEFNWVETFDIETKNNHNFFANGYLVHNSGKEVTCLNYLVRQAWWHRVGTYVYFFPTSTLGRRILWDGANKDGKRFLDYIPKRIIEGKPNSVEMKIRLTNGSVIQIIGTDQVVNVGINPVGCVFSEYSLQDPKCWNFVRPILRENGGWAVFNFTPRGKNWAHDIYLMAKNNDNWFCQKLSIDDTKVLDNDDMDAERNEDMSEHLIQQEYYCNFDQGIEGAYYARYLQKAELEGRITSVPYDPNCSVDTYWDLGVSDETVILMCQNVGNEVHIINMYRNQGEGLGHYAKWVQCEAEKWGYVYGEHHAPHDIQVRELGSGAQTRLQIAKDLGISFKIVPNISIQEGIELSRGIFPRIWIDRDKCNYLVKCLENYHKNFNERLNVYSNKPVHDWSSHCCDAWRYMSIMQNKRRRGTMSEEEAMSMQRAYVFRH